MLEFSPLEAKVANEWEIPKKESQGDRKIELGQVFIKSTVAMQLAKHMGARFKRNILHY